tara:strand:+ start:144 stop:389 length:246 start_codon:yes stop_codon:yes gene_type:complete
MKAEKYLESIGLENAIGEEFMNDDDKSYYTVEELMESYHKAKLDLLTIPVVVKSLPRGDEIWLKAQETDRFLFEEWYDELK